ncbi:MAG TPA: methionine--tRNA ligase [Candidatus Dojkabacteria bacterium]|nr:methionine--tRNA ligase [Candidatus Dojkabacteria bacterium]
MLKFEDFKKLEIKIGTIIEAERVTGTDRLLKVIVDMGDEKRQVVAGFGHKYSPEDLIGKQVPIVLNIEKAVIRGVESNGIFVALEDDEPVLLLPERKVQNGAIVK